MFAIKNKAPSVKYYIAVVLCYRLTGWFLHKLLGKLLSSVLLHKGQMEILKKASQVRGRLVAVWF